MKTLVGQNGVSLYTFDDSEKLEITDTEITVDDPPRFIIGDCNSSNATLYTGVTPPADWVGGKYLFDGTDWTVNPSYVEPTEQ